MPPKAIANYLTAEILGVEIEYIGTRISHYQYIERYREHFQAADRNMAAAFVTHTHALRGGEIYIIMEQCSACLSFLSDLASDFGLLRANNSKALEKTFKSTFQRHLRELHRIVHAHDRQSFNLRIITASVSSCQHDELKRTVRDAI